MKTVDGSAPDGIQDKLRGMLHCFLMSALEVSVELDLYNKVCKHNAPSWRARVDLPCPFHRARACTTPPFGRHG